MEGLRKISSKTVMGKVEKPEKATKLFTVIGVAHRTRRGDGDNGPWVSLIGRFEATNILTGEVSTAPQCFLPKPMDEILAFQLEEMEPLLDSDGKVQLDADDNERTKRVTESVQFAYEIGVKPTDTPIGYEYTTNTIVEPGGADPLAELRGALPKLPAPSKKKGAK